jgi:2'-5' RNA ligase
MLDHVSMRMSAALVPPPPVLEDLSAVVLSVRGSDRQLEAVPAELVSLPLGNFGNVGLADRMDLEAVLKEEVSRWAPLELRFRGASALVEPGDDSVWAELDGDLDQLNALGSAVPRAVQRLGFLIDRRSFRTRVRIGRITTETGVDYLERLLARLEGYVGPAWTAHHVSLLRHRPREEAERPQVDVLHDLRLAGQVRAVSS